MALPFSQPAKSKLGKAITAYGQGEELSKKQLTTMEQAASKLFADAGVTINELHANMMLNNNKISNENLETLDKAGIPEAKVTAFMNAYKALQS